MSKNTLPLKTFSDSKATVPRLAWRGRAGVQLVIHASSSGGSTHGSYSCKRLRFTFERQFDNTFVRVHLFVVVLSVKIILADMLTDKVIKVFVGRTIFLHFTTHYVLRLATCQSA